jgi:hypothetical protein
MSFQKKPNLVNLFNIELCGRIVWYKNNMSMALMYYKIIGKPQMSKNFKINCLINASKN